MGARRAMPLIAVTALVVIAAAGATGYALRPAPAPELLQSSGEETAAPVIAQSFEDSRRVQVALVTGADQTLSVQTSGTLTASRCQDGTEISSGTVVAHVDERPLIGLHTAVPLYRDLSAGDDGADVAALQSELVRLGHLDASGADGEFGPRTGQALQRLRQSAGLDSGERAAQRSEFIWLPSSTVTGVACALKVGDPVSQGATIATSRGGLERVEVQVLPDNLAPGDRTIRIGSVQGPVDARGVATDAAFLAELSADEKLISALAQDPGSTVTANLALSSPLPAYSIPVGALIGGQERRCVKTEAGTVRAELLGSSLGTAVVAFVDADPPPPSVVIGAALEGARCG
ncbi:peptidoglycan hydrolase-like protein with peptidoglycan-binding domain [Microbacterium sp. SORGH_AS428]|uniref:peptidoglycan-binding domain-containing protein n=1 Tax=Microbacterium sp. SORGH_AS_0428 TaxID=3041788 RepID=UPI00285B0808|nr:peptidoglycan-binding domain-containing protein [Microbacterium sp. SORGH_AS_0428]MDR6199997.1 peptidoglycan hydrolase-like protein with peptidoglycan-binding domain [Microbacterium sp. SORGH_AS_0428]